MRPTLRDELDALELRSDAIREDARVLRDASDLVRADAARLRKDSRDLGVWHASEVPLAFGARPPSGRRRGL